MKVCLTLFLLILVAGCGGNDDTAGKARQTNQAQESSQAQPVTHSDGTVTTEANVAAAYTLVQQGEVAKLREMLAQKPSIANDPTRRGDHLLNIIVDTRPEFPNMHDSIKVLLEAGGDPNQDAPNLLRKAIWRGDPESLKLLLEYGADPRVVSPKKKMNMVDYARGTGDERLIDIVDDWEARH